jgi:hypothetical protein
MDISYALDVLQLCSFKACNTNLYFNCIYNVFIAISITHFFTFFYDFCNFSIKIFKFGALFSSIPKKWVESSNATKIYGGLSDTVSEIIEHEHARARGARNSPAKQHF